MQSDVRECLDFIQKYPGAYQVVRGQCELLENAGYSRLFENEEWTLKQGGKYYLTRNSSSLIAFRIPENHFRGFMVMASHGDSPGLQIKPSPEILQKDQYTLLNVEGYGGAILSTWFDRPLSVAGRIFVRTASGIREELINIDRDLLLIPSLAIHMNRDANKGTALSIQKDMLPLYGGKKADHLTALVAAEAGVDERDVLSHELMLYVRSAPSLWGADGEFMSSPRLDNVECAYALLKGFLNAESGQAVPVHVVFDNEEVGSGTRQGAASTFLKDTLERIVLSVGGKAGAYRQWIAESMMLSADNAHGMHPNYTEKCDPVNQPVLGGGVVLKHAANQKYTTNAASEALCRIIAEKADVSLQHFVNRSDLPGGSTLGNISGTQVPLMCADIGLPQLAMHSAYETASVQDLTALIRLAGAFYASATRVSGTGEYCIV